MKNSSSQLSLTSSSFCHNISEQNYFLSPKMPVKDHVLAFKSPVLTPKQPSSYKLPGILNKLDTNCMQKSQALSKSIHSLSQMNLLKQKNLYVISHKGKEKALNSNIHTRQTNPGYSRNALGGLYTK